MNNVKKPNNQGLPHEFLDANDLTRWWWPGQWLRIVWAVWTNQLWYLQHVRPRLHGIHSVTFFFQALLGGSLLGLVPAAGAGLILEATGMHPVWKLWAFGFLVGVLAAAMWGGAAMLFNGANWGVSACAIYGAVYSFCASIIIGTITHFPFPQITFLLYGSIGGLLLGISENLYGVVKQGKIVGTFMTIEQTAFCSVATGIVAKSISVGAITGLAFLFGTQIGRIWATRQGLDEEARQVLADING